MMKYKARPNLPAMATIVLLCLSLLCLFPLSAQATGTDEPPGIPENELTTGGVVGEEPAPGSQPSSSQEPEEDDGSGSMAVPDASEQAGSEDGASQDNEQATSVASAETDKEKDNSGAEESSAAESEPEEPSAPESEPEEAIAPDDTSLVKSSKTMPGYNVFEVDSFTALTEALATTSYPSEEYPENNVYILLTGDVNIEAGLILHRSIEKVVIDGDSQYTLSEIGRARSQVSPSTVEVRFKDLAIVGRQFFGLFDNIHVTDVLYIYERVKYTGPQLLWAFYSTAHFYDCDINISAGLDPAHEVAEIRDIHMFGNSQITHSSTMPVFYLYNGGNLVLSAGAALNINALGANDAILQTALAQSALRLEDGALLHIQGSSRRLARGERLHSIFLGSHALFHWEANLSGNDYITINSAGGAKDAIYLSQGAAFHVAPYGSVSEGLIRIDGGNVVVGPGASLSLKSILYIASNSTAPFSFAYGGKLNIGKGATFTMEIANSRELSTGLLYFNTGGQSGFSVDKDATVVLRGNRAKGAVCFVNENSRVEITDPDYLEIGLTTGFPIYFYNASVARPCTLNYTDVQQINYWSAGSKTYLNGGRYLGRWAAETGKFSVHATITAGGNKGMSLELSGDPLDPLWTPTLNTTNFDMNQARILSAGKVGIEANLDGDTRQGRVTAPMMGVPYSQGSVRLRAGTPAAGRWVSSLAPATPQFTVAPSQAVGENEEVSVWAEYGYVFHHNAPATTGGTLTLAAPEQIQFGTLPAPFGDMEVSTQNAYVLQVQDDRRAGNGWQVTASFSGFSNIENRLNSTLVVNDIPLGQTPQQIVTSAGSETVPLEARLLVPGGDAEIGTYTGTITWTVVDAP